MRFLNPIEERFPRLWALLDQLSVLVIASLAFWVFIWILPAALVALFSAVAIVVRPVPGEVLGRFWRGLRRTFGRAMLLGLIDLVVGAVLVGDIWLMRTIGGTLGQVGVLFFGTLVLLVLMINVFTWPLLAWYPQPLGKLLKRAFLLAAVHPFLALVGLIGGALVILLMLFLPGPLTGLLAAMGPAAVASVLSLAAWQAMKRYAKEEDEFAE